MSNASDADGARTLTPEKREGEKVPFDCTSEDGWLPTMRSVS